MTKKSILVLIVTIALMMFASCESNNTSSEQSSGNDIESSVITSAETESTTTTPIVTTTASTTTTSTSKAVTSNTMKTTAPQTKGGEFRIGTSPTIPAPAKYSCGFPNHTCSNEQAHVIVCELEKDGCPYCGSHSCISFYTLDQWGNSCPDPTKCPMYDVHKDPIKYCPKCGRLNGNGNNGTCQKWLVDTVCPICGQLVKANECHTHN